MAVDIFFTVYVDNPEEVLQTYTHIRIWKAPFKLGVYTEITDSNSRLVLQPGVKTYTYHDEFGNVTEWYRSTFYEGNGPTESMPSDTRNFGSWGILADSISRRLMSEGNNLSLGQLYDAVFDGSCDTIRVPDDLGRLSTTELSWLCRRSVRHALATLLNDYVAKPSVSKGTVNVSLSVSASQLMQRIRQLDEEWQSARANDIRIFEGRLVQLQDSDKTFGMIVGQGYEIEPLTGYDYTTYADTRTESVFDQIWRW